MNSTYHIIEGQGIESIDNNTSTYLFGCTNPNSCNYDPDATIDDGSCIFINSQEIIGETIVEPLLTYNYSYDDDSILEFETTVLSPIDTYGPIVESVI